MNTIEDLRATLHTHADGLGDELAATRRLAVHQRVAVVRRRRRAAVAGAVAAVVAVVGGVSVLPGLVGRTPADPAAERRLAGAVAPATLTALGFAYAFDQGVEGDGIASLELGPSDEPRLVSWTGTGSLLLRTPTGKRSVRGEFTDFSLIPEGVDGRLSVRGFGRVAIASYTLTRLADGVVSDGATPRAVFRDQVAEEPLLGAAFGPGDQPLSFPVTPTGAQLRVSHVCRGFPAGAWLSVSIDGLGSVGGTCSGEWWSVDAGTGGFVTSVTPGRTYRIATRLTQGEDGPVLTLPDAEIGVGVYDAGLAPRQTSRGFELPDYEEADGHLWRRGEWDSTPLLSVESVGGSRTWRVDGPLGRPTCVVVHGRGLPGGSRMSAAVDRTPFKVWMNDLELPGSMSLGVVERSSTIAVQTRGPVGPRSLALVAFYELVD